MLINMGPQHPSTHGVLRLQLELDGETVVRCTPHVGYVHTGIEKTIESRNWQQAVPCTDRMDYLCPLINNLGYCLAVEKLLQCEIPPRAQVARVILSELTRIASHLVWLGTHALDIGAMSVFLYCFRERESVLDLFDLTTGQRMMTSYIRIGGLAHDLRPDFPEAVGKFCEIFPSRVDEYEGLLKENEIWQERTMGVGVVTAEQALAIGLAGPNLRACGVPWDLRKDMPYTGYEQYSFEVPVETAGDAYARFRVRMREMRESVKIIQQALNKLPEGPFRTEDRKVSLPPRIELNTSMESLIHHFKLVTEGILVPAGEVYQAVESPRGELGFYVVSDGTNHAYRCHVREPNFVGLQALPLMMEGGLVADAVVCIGSLDPVIGGTDR
ncbi:MAG: NADH dehydrogenase (quinone) subunit D [Chloroflexi bacterium]|nr:NADH dehydrogenase (quinone) subunit D [Chloroflexota bacterium]